MTYGQMFTELLNEIYGEVKICGHTYPAGYALKQVDPTAWRYEFLCWVDAEGFGDVDEDDIVRDQDDQDEVDEWEDE